MILFTNGNHHVAGAMATNSYIVANNDSEHWQLENRPHPDNYDVSWGLKLSQLIKFDYTTVTKFSENNDDIINSTKRWIEDNAWHLSDSDMFIIIGWNDANTREEANKILNFHLLLKEYGVKHIFFDTYNKIPLDYDFDKNYIDVTYNAYLKSKGHETVINSDIYYDKKAHSEWMNYLLKWIVKYEMI